MRKNFRPYPSTVGVNLLSQSERCSHDDNKKSRQPGTEDCDEETPEGDGKFTLKKFKIFPLDTRSGLDPSEGRSDEQAMEGATLPFRFLSPTSEKISLTFACRRQYREKRRSPELSNRQPNLIKIDFLSRFHSE